MASFRRGLCNCGEGSNCRLIPAYCMCAAGGRGKRTVPAAKGSQGTLCITWPPSASWSPAPPQQLETERDVLHDIQEKRGASRRRR